MTKSLKYRNRLHEVVLSDTASGAELIAHAKTISGLSNDRLRVVYESGDKRIQVAPDQKLAELPTKTFLIRDLGPQFGYRAVFLIEYAGPFLIWPAVQMIISSLFETGDSDVIYPLWKTTLRNGIPPFFQSPDHATIQFIQELFVLLGICSNDCFFSGLKFQGS
jgi:hypothetical protein